MTEPVKDRLLLVFWLRRELVNGVLHVIDVDAVGFSEGGGRERGVADVAGRQFACPAQSPRTSTAIRVRLGVRVVRVVVCRRGRGRRQPLRL